MTPEESPTTPVAPKTATEAFRLRCFLSRNVFSTQATIAAAVVNRCRRVGKQGDAERRHQRLLGGGQHVEGQDRVLAADEQSGPHPVFGGRENMRPGRGRSPLERHIRVGEHRIVATSNAMFASNGLMCLSGVNM